MRTVQGVGVFEFARCAGFTFARVVSTPDAKRFLPTAVRGAADSAGAALVALDEASVRGTLLFREVRDGDGPLAYLLSSDPTADFRIAQGFAGIVHELLGKCRVAPEIRSRLGLYPAPVGDDPWFGWSACGDPPAERDDPPVEEFVDMHSFRLLDEPVPVIWDDDYLGPWLASRS